MVTRSVTGAAVGFVSVVGAVGVLAELTVGPSDLAWTAAGVIGAVGGAALSEMV